MGLLSISTVGDPNSHGAGFLQSSQIKVNCRGIPIILFGDLSTPDGDCDDDHPPIHCFPMVITSSVKVFTQSRGVHRRADKRACGAVTVLSPAGNIKVFAG